jgi:hypothetical protein
MTPSSPSHAASSAGDASRSTVMTVLRAPSALRPRFRGRGAPAVKVLDMPCRTRMIEPGAMHHINPS